jgi:hypothetical protein
MPSEAIPMTFDDPIEPLAAEQAVIRLGARDLTQ